MEKVPVRPTSFVCVDCSMQPAKCYCTTCSRLLCLYCGIDHTDNGCLVDSCDVTGIRMMKELLKESEGSSNCSGISQAMKNATFKMKKLFKWLEKETTSKLSECQRKLRISMLPNEAKQHMIKLKNEENLIGLYMLCKNIKEQKNCEESKEKIRNDANTTMEYQNKIEVIFNEFCKKFKEINAEISMVKLKESNKVVGQKPNPEPLVKPNLIPKPQNEVESIFCFSEN